MMDIQEALEGLVDSGYSNELAAISQHITALTAEVEALRRDAELWRAHVSRGSNTSHRCKRCGLPYTPVTENEDCPGCGYDGSSPIDAARQQEAGQTVALVPVPTTENPNV